MPSFTRRVPSTAPPPLPTLIKTGVPSLDDLLHLPPSSSTLIFSPDVHSSWPRLIARYFTAQAFLGSENIIVIGEGSASRDLVRGCMWVDERSSSNNSANASAKGDESGSEGEMDVEADNRSKIAWRYGGMEKFKTSIGEKGQLNLSTSLPKSIIEQAQKAKGLQYLDIDSDDDGLSSSSDTIASGSSRGWAKLASVLGRLQAILGAQDGRTTTRIIVNELGSADWDDPSSHEIHRFLHALKSLVRGRNAVAMVTLPPSLVRTLDEASIKRLSWAVDASLEIKGFADDPALQPIFHPLHGLITLHSFPHSHLLPPSIKHSSLLGLSSGGGGSENNLGFRARRKRWGIETVHLGIDGGVGERRTEPAPEVARMVSAAPINQAEGVERAAPAQAPDPAGEMAMEKNEVVLNTTTTTLTSEVGAGAGAGGVKKKEKRARVRFGEDEILDKPAASTLARDQAQAHGHGHRHDHDHQQQQQARPGSTPAPRATVRHDRPDLYEF